MSLSPAKRDLLARMLREKGAGHASESPPLAARPAGDPVPLYPNQEGLWFIDQLKPGEANYNVPGTVRLRGTLDAAALERALGAVVARHESLRTTFRADDDGTPRQWVAPPAPFRLDVVDLTDRPAPERRAAATRLAEEEARTPFDLATGPLMRARLLRLAADDHVFLVNFFHGITDGVSMGVFSRELHALYAAFADGQPDPLPPVRLHYGDFATWHAARERSPWLDREVDAWRTRLAGDPPPLELPTDRPRPPVRSYAGAHEALVIPRDLADRTQTMARTVHASLYQALLAAYAIVLRRATKQTDFCIGSTFGNRNTRDLEAVIGFFANTLPLRIDASGDPTFAELLARVRDVNLEAHDHHEVPFTTLVKRLRPERNLGENPFYRVVFDYLTPDHNPAVYGYGLRSTVRESVKLGPVDVTPMDVECGVSRFDIAVFLWDMPDGLVGTIEYSTELFEAATVRRLFECLEQVLRAVADKPDTRIGALIERIDDAERTHDAEREASAKQSMRAKLGRVRRRSIRPTPEGSS